MKLSLVIPCYNEEKNIPLIVARLREIIGGRQDVEVILVDNGSRDGTADILASELAQGGSIRSFSVAVNEGYGHGILEGLRQTTGDVLAWTHADMQTDPTDVLTAFDLYKQHVPAKVIVKGRRKNRAVLEWFFTFGMQLLASLALKVRLEDVNAQPKLFSREFYQKFIAPDAPKDFSLDLYLLYQAQRQGYRILEVPVFFAQRLHGEAKGGGSWKTRIRLIRRTFSYIFQLRHKINVQADK